MLCYQVWITRRHHRPMKALIAWSVWVDTLAMLLCNSLMAMALLRHGKILGFALARWGQLANLR